MEKGGREEGDTTASDNYVNIRPRALITPVAMPTSLAVAAAVFSLTGRQAVQGSQLQSAAVASALCASSTNGYKRPSLIVPCMMSRCMRRVARSVNYKPP